MSAHRSHLKETIEYQSERAGVWRAILDSDALQLLREGDRAAAEALIAQILQAAPAHEPMPPGERMAVPAVRF